MTGIRHWKESAKTGGDIAGFIINKEGNGASPGLTIVNYSSTALATTVQLRVNRTKANIIIKIDNSAVSIKNVPKQQLDTFLIA